MCIGTTLAVFQSFGIVPWLREAWKNRVKAGVSSSARVFRRLVGSWSGPVALCSLRLLRSFLTPAGVTVMGFMPGCGLISLLGMFVLSSFCVKTNWNCWLSMLALVLLSDRITPSGPSRHVIPMLSFRLLLRKLYSLLGLTFPFSGEIMFVMYSLYATLHAHLVFFFNVWNLWFCLDVLCLPLDLLYAFFFCRISRLISVVIQG